jgi:hypothetical protein
LKDVKLSLVSGTPQSFIQNISQPYYTRQPVFFPESDADAAGAGKHANSA